MHIAPSHRRLADRRDAVEPEHRRRDRRRVRAEAHRLKTAIRGNSRSRETRPQVYPQQPAHAPSPMTAILPRRKTRMYRRANLSPYDASTLVLTATGREDGPPEVS